MNFLGQPESYSDMLQRIFVATLSVGLLCTFWISSVSPAFKHFLNSWNTETSIGLIDGLKAWYLLIPLTVALFSRIILLHDKISDLFKIRRRFDINHIIKPIAAQVGFEEKNIDWYIENRDTLMRNIFYKYASFIDPKIDTQLVRTAADRWGWFWCMIEPTTILFLTSIIFLLLQNKGYFFLSLGLMVMMLIFAAATWPLLIKGTRPQLEEILSNPKWKKDILNKLLEIESKTTGGSMSREIIEPQILGEEQVFDVFISYNNDDKETVEVIAEELRKRDITVWFDKWELIPGQPWQESLEYIVKTARSAAVFVGKDGIGPWQNREMRGCLNEFVERNLPVIPVLLPNAKDLPELPIFLKQFTWVDLRSGITQTAIDELQWGITRRKTKP